MAKISSGSFDLNKFLYGGYDTDIVSVLYGGPGTGKTNFCLIAAVSQAKKGKKVIFIDTEGGFSIERVKQLVGDNGEKDKVLKNIFLLKPTNFDEQKKSFGELNKYLKDEVSLIVVDGMTILYRLDFAAAREKNDEAMQTINSELARQMKTLAEISRKKHIPVLVTNQIYRWEDTDKMVGGDILKYWGKCLIELVNDKGRRVVYLRKHRSLPEKNFVFTIDDKGIRKRGWI
ncbi:DNA repair and recombination protein RadB [Candidatus Pacearchaeota archaeon]|nr:DNA repair and recombination protein RadB [Candidatus Pacearchaeota archaeon]